MRRLLAACGAALLILIVVKGFGVARLRLVTSGVLVVLVLFLYGVGPFFGVPAIDATKRVIHLLDRSYSARPLAEQLATLAPGEETVAVFRVRRDVEYGLSFYRNHEVVNYEESGVPDEQHLLVIRVAGRGGVDLHTPRRWKSTSRAGTMSNSSPGRSRDWWSTWWAADNG